MPTSVYGAGSAYAVSVDSDQIIRGKKTFQAKDSSTTPVVLKGASGQTANLIEVQDNAGATIASVNNLGEVTTNRIWMPGQTSNIEIGAAGVANTPFIDFHSSATATDRDARLIASGGDTTAAGGVLTADVATFMVTGKRTGAAPFVVREQAAQTSNIAEFQANSGTSLLSVDANGNVRVRPAAAQGFDGGSNLSISTGGPGDKGLVVRAATSQTGNLAEFQAPDGAVRTRIGRIGALGVNMNAEGVAWLSVTGNATTDTLSVVRGLPSQSGNLFVAQNSAGTGVFSIAADGRTIIGRRDTGDASWGAAGLEIQDVGFPRIAFHQPGEVASSIGQVPNSEAIRTWNNPGNGYANFYAGAIFDSDNRVYSASNPPPSSAPHIEGKQISGDAVSVTWTRAFAATPVVQHEMIVGSSAYGDYANTYSISTTGASGSNANSANAWPHHFSAHVTT